MPIWYIVRGPLLTLTLGAVLALAALALLREYGRLFRADPKSVMSVEVLTQAVTGAGGPGYLAAFLLAMAALCVVLSAYSLVLNVSSYLGVA
jgi:hypothetical protein